MENSSPEKKNTKDFKKNLGNLKEIISNDKAIGEALLKAQSEMEKKGLDADQVPTIIAEAFNQAMAEFIEDLLLAAPENNTLHIAKTALVELRTWTPQEPLKRWRKGVKGKEKYLQSRTPKNEEFFLKQVNKMEYICELDIPKYWDDLSNEEKDQVFHHLAWLNKISTLLELCDADQLNGVSQLAQICSEDILKQNPDINSSGKVEFDKILSSVVKNLSGQPNILKGLGIDKKELENFSQNGKINPNFMMNMMSNLGLKKG